MEINRKNPFKVPVGYFDDLEEILLKKAKDNYNAYGFQTPKVYFNKLEFDIIEKTIETKKVSNKKIENSLLGVMAATVATLYIMLYFIFSPSSGTLVKLKKENAFDEYIETYYLEDLNSFEILSMLEDGEIENTINYNSKP